MKIVIAGGSGFLGHELIKHFNQDAVQIVILTRQPNYKDGSIQYIQWLTPNSTPENYIEDADVIINLAGVSLNEGRWTNGKKEAIYASRMQATKELFRLVNRLTNKPKT
ncbi:MAG: NAD-dependent epimerase/dehydratase family protein [Kurthia sp.]